MPPLFRPVARATFIVALILLTLMLAVPTPVGFASSARGARRLRDAPLALLSPAAAEYVASREGTVGVAVVVPRRAAIFSTRDNAPLYLASVAKVPIMLTLMSQAADEGRPLSDSTATDLWAMISLSDNDAADRLWGAVSGAEGVRAYLRSVGVDDIEPDAEGYWGASTATPRAMALLLAKLLQGDALDPEGQVRAMNLMGNIEALDQRWGVSAGLPAELPAGASSGLKDGWYWDDDGWWVNSVGYVVPPNGGRYSLAILTNGQPSFAYGVETVETVARLIHMELSGMPVDP